MALPDSWKQINRLLDQIGTLQTRIVDGVRRKGKSIEQIKLLERQIATRKARVEVLKREYLAGFLTRSRNEGATAPGEAPMTVDEAMMVAATLRMQRPMIYNTEEWPAFRRVCAALAELFEARLAGAAKPFAPEQFLLACGLSSDDARRLSSPPEETRH